MRSQHGGHIVVNVTSIVGLVAMAFWGFYCSSKFAVEGFSE
jgi:short-subunit dehydrogenase